MLRQSNISPFRSSKSNVLERWRWFGRRKESSGGKACCTLLRRSANPHFVRLSSSSSSSSSVPRADRRAPPRLGRPRLVAHYHPPTPFLRRKLKARLRPRAAVARADRTEPRRRAATTHYWFAWERTKEPESSRRGGGGGGGGRAREGWRASCRLVQERRSPRRITRQGLGEKRPWSATPLSLPIEIRFPGETVFLKKRIRIQKCIARYDFVVGFRDKVIFNVLVGFNKYIMKRGI